MPRKPKPTTQNNKVSLSGKFAALMNKKRDEDPDDLIYLTEPEADKADTPEPVKDAPQADTPEPIKQADKPQAENMPELIKQAIRDTIAAEFKQRAEKLAESKKARDAERQAEKQKRTAERLALKQKQKAEQDAEAKRQRDAEKKELQNLIMHREAQIINTVKAETAHAFGRRLMARQVY